MKTIGVIGAMEEEISVIKSKMEIISTKNIVGLDFCLGKLHGKNIVLVRSGIGKVNAAICAQILIDLYGTDCCINIGVAGAISKDLKISDVVIASELLYHDFDVTGFGYDLGVIPRMDTSSFKADQELVSIAENAAKEIVNENTVIVGKITTGDRFVSNDDDKLRIWNATKALCVEMEGAAIAHVCHLNKIPFIVIRAISDAADGSATDSFDKFVEISAAISSDILEKMLEKI